MRTGMPSTMSSVTLAISRVGGPPIGDRASSNNSGDRSGSGVTNIGFAAIQSTTHGSSTPASRTDADQPLMVWLANRLRLPLLLLVALAAVSTVGYEVLEGYGWVDAVYMTVITLGTIGYGE